MDVLTVILGSLAAMDPDSTITLMLVRILIFYSMRIHIRLFTLMRIQIQIQILASKTGSNHSKRAKIKIPFGLTSAK